MNSSSHRLTCIILLVCFSLIQSLANNVRPQDEICKISDTNTCDLESLQSSSIDGSTLIFPGGSTRCAFDDYENPTTGFSANGSYFFQVFPSTNSTNNKKKLMLFFQGGGGCFADDTCNFEVACSLNEGSIFSYNARPASSGIFNRTDTQNPFQEWNMVHLPYCTGDVHLGNTVRAPRTSPVPSFKLSAPTCTATSASVPMNQVGYVNTYEVLRWTRRNFPDPSQIIVAGLSAGSIAAQSYARLIATMWEVEEKDISFDVIADSYIGITPPERTSADLLNFYGSCRESMGFTQDVLEKCQNETLMSQDVVLSTLATVPRSRFLFINSKKDFAQRMFYQLVKLGIAGFPITDLWPADTFYNEMNDILHLYSNASSTTDQQSRASSFIVDGEEHGFITGSRLYTAENDKGETLASFISRWIQREEQAVEEKVDQAEEEENEDEEVQDFKEENVEEAVEEVKEDEEVQYFKKKNVEEAKEGGQRGTRLQGRNTRSSRINGLVFHPLW